MLRPACLSVHGHPRAQWDDHLPLNGCCASACIRHGRRIGPREKSHPLAPSEGPQFARSKRTRDAAGAKVRDASRLRRTNKGEAIQAFTPDGGLQSDPQVASTNIEALFRKAWTYRIPLLLVRALLMNASRPNRCSAPRLWLELEAA